MACSANHFIQKRFPNSAPSRSKFANFRASRLIRSSDRQSFSTHFSVPPITSPARSLGRPMPWSKSTRAIAATTNANSALPASGHAAFVPGSMRQPSSSTVTCTTRCPKPGWNPKPPEPAKPGRRSLRIPGKLRNDVPLSSSWVHYRSLNICRLIQWPNT